MAWSDAGVPPFNEVLVNLPRGLKQGLLIAVDGLLIVFCVWAAFALRLGEPWSFFFRNAIWLVPLMVVLTLPAFYVLGFYRSVIRYVSGHVFFDAAKGVGVGALLSLAVWELAQGPVVPRSAWLIYGLLAVLTVGAFRLLLRGYVSVPRGAYAAGERVVIYGAGDAGAQLAVALQHSREYRPVAFLDDKPDLRGTEILGLKVHPSRRLPDLIPKLEVNTVLLAMPSVPRKQRREILDGLESLPLRVLAMPGLTELAAGTRRVDELREVDVEDVLGRDPVRADESLLAARLGGKSVMVTGAGGSIGAELCRQIIRRNPKRLVALELSEYQLYHTEQNLRRLLDQIASSVELIPILGSVQDRNRLVSVMQAFEVQTVFHAAAYKHVPIVEHNPMEGIANNVFGTWRCAEAAIRAGVEIFVLVSTDKAVRPTNVMGASKRLAELVLQGLAQPEPETRLCMVRFGNVLASSGSVVPLFREQIRRGGPVTVTHPDMVRYFMTIPEAAQLVIQAGAMAQGGDVFLLEMGEPVKIVDLARRMIHLSGFEVRDDGNPDGEIEIQFTGLRAGEKLYEELLIGDDDLATEHPRIKRARERAIQWDALHPALEELVGAVESGDHRTIRRVLEALVEEYRPGTEIGDRVWLARGQPERLHPLPDSLH
jgi:FlaA1/EpsC-like NDP-sugar epimerase